MAQAFECLSEKHIVFLEAQPCFFCGNSRRRWPGEYFTQGA